MKRFLTAVALSSALAVPAFAAPDTYTIDSKHTFPTFEVNHLGYSVQRGRFDKTSGTITVDLKAKTGGANVVIDTTSLDMGFDEWNKHLSDEKFFNVAKFPTMTFKSSKFTFKGDQLVQVDGDLTLLGVTKPVVLKVDLFKCAMHPMMKKDACGANATTTIKRSDFGMSAYVPMVGDEIKIAFGIEAIKN
jgi:polyisoprenoid-binding protein YceI